MAARVHRGGRSRVRRADPAAGRDLAGRLRPGARHRHRRGPGGPPAVRQAHGSAGGRASTRRPARSPRPLGAAAASPTSAAGAVGLPFADASFDAAVACLVFEHIDDLDGRSPRWPGCCAPAGASCCSSTIRCCRPRAAAGSTTRSSTRPSSTGASGPYLSEGSTLEQVEAGVFIRFVHRPLSRYLNAMADAGLALERMLEPAPPAGLPGPGPRVRRGRHHPAPGRAGRSTSLTDPADVRA